MIYLHTYVLTYLITTSFAISIFYIRGGPPEVREPHAKFNVGYIFKYFFLSNSICSLLKNLNLIGKLRFKI